MVLAPGVSEGPLVGGVVGKVVKDDGSSVPYKVKALSGPEAGETHWYSKRDVVLAPDAAGSGNSKRVAELPSVTVTERVRARLTSLNGGGLLDPPMALAATVSTFAKDIGKKQHHSTATKDRKKKGGAVAEGGATPGTTDEGGSTDWEQELAGDDAAAGGSGAAAPAPSGVGLGALLLRDAHPGLEVAASSHGDGNGSDSEEEEGGREGCTIC